jgi:flagellar hook assembly protein FlgD
VDFEGAISCPNNNVVTVEFNNNSTVDLSQNTPNPFGGETRFTVTIPETQNVTIEVVDIFGKIVKTIVADETMKGTFSYSWDGTDENGMKVVDGNYIYRLTAGSEILIKKMSYIKSY